MLREWPVEEGFLNSVIVTPIITALLVDIHHGELRARRARVHRRRCDIPPRGGAQMLPFFLSIIPISVILRFVPLTGGNDIAGQGLFVGSGLVTGMP